MNKTLIKHIKNEISSLEAESNRIKEIKPQKGFEVITYNTKRMYLYELDKVISNNQLRLANVTKEREAFTMIMLDQIFTGGMEWFSCRGDDTFIKLDTKMLMSFDKQLEIAIDITKKFNLKQCEIPIYKGKKLEYNLIVGTLKNLKNDKVFDFDLYDNYKIFDNRIKSVMKDMKYIFNVEPYSDKTWDDKTRLGFKIMCA
jgi:hypothetical protein